MLLEEVHGKRCQAVKGNEDFLTSAMFGQLHHIKQADFWSAVFRRALTVQGRESTLLSEIHAEVIQFERDLIRERQREGMALAKLKEGKYTGRKHSLTPAQAKELCRRVAKGETKTRSSP